VHDRRDEAFGDDLGRAFALVHITELKVRPVVLRTLCVTMVIRGIVSFSMPGTS